MLAAACCTAFTETFSPIPAWQAISTVFSSIPQLFYHACFSNIEVWSQKTQRLRALRTCTLHLLVHCLFVQHSLVTSLVSWLCGCSWIACWMLVTLNPTTLLIFFFLKSAFATWFMQIFLLQLWLLFQLFCIWHHHWLWVDCFVRAAVYIDTKPPQAC